MELQNKQIPQIKAAQLLINKEEKMVTVRFIDNEDELDDRKNHIISQITMPFDEYYNFAASFLAIGLQAQSDMEIDLGINLSDDNEEEV